MNLDNEYVYVPLAEPPAAPDLADLMPIAPVTVVMRAWVDPHTGHPKYVSEQFTDPDSGRELTVWSRVTDSLSYVRGSSS